MTVELTVTDVIRANWNDVNAQTTDEYLSGLKGADISAAPDKQPVETSKILTHTASIVNQTP